MMSRHFRLRSELSGASLKNQPPVPGSFFNQFVTDSNELIEETAKHRRLILACGSLLAMAPLSSDLKRNCLLIMEL